MEDKVMVLAKQLLLPEFSHLELSKIEFCHFPVKLFEQIWEVDVLIVYDDLSARVMRNRFGGRKPTLDIGNVGNWVKSKLYLMPERGGEKHK
jgi:hypothetical protein